MRHMCATVESNLCAVSEAYTLSRMRTHTKQNSNNHTTTKANATHGTNSRACKYPTRAHTCVCVHASGGSRWWARSRRVSVGYRIARRIPYSLRLISKCHIMNNIQFPHMTISRLRFALREIVCDLIALFSSFPARRSIAHSRHIEYYH